MERFKFDRLLTLIMNPIGNLSRITPGPIDALVTDLSRLKTIGETTFRQNRIHPSEIIMKAPDETYKFRIGISKVLSLTGQQFLQTVDRFLAEMDMYLENMTIAPDKLWSNLGLMPYYKMSGRLYREMK